jgi:Cu2+-exporting ATPase
VSGVTTLDRALERDLARGDAADAAPARCWHCGLDVPEDVDVRVPVDGTERPMCCHGCAAAATFLEDAGLAAYYRLRETRTGVPAPEPDARDDWATGELADRYVVRGEDGDRAELALDGLRCAACAWLLEEGLGEVDGVRDVDVALATGRVRVGWDPARVRLADLVGRIRRLGFVCVPARDEAEAGLHARERRRALRAVGVSGVIAMQVMMLAVADYAGVLGAGAIDTGYRTLLLWAQMILASVAVFTCAGTFFEGARRALRSRHVTMDVPVALAIALAWGASVLVLVSGGTAHGAHVWFDSVTMFIFLLRTARWVELDVRHRFAGADRSLAGLLPALAHREDARGAVDLPTDLLDAGDRIRVRPGEIAPADGVVVEGSARVDRSALTGESVPVPATSGSPVEAGSRVLDGALVLEVERRAADSAVAGIPALLDRARGRRARVAGLADRAARWLLGGVLLACAAAGLAWSLVDPARAFEVVLATLIATCPCALSLATPTALAAATTRLRRRGILVTDPDAFESIARCDVVCFDKTGTLTIPGALRLRRLEGPAEADALVAALEVDQDHPIAEAARALAADAPRATDARAVDGLGVEGTVDGVRWRFGHPDLVDAHGEALVLARRADAGWTVVARYARDEAPAPEAAQTVAALRELGLAPCVLSGDAADRTAAAAARLDIDDARGECRPDDKLADLERRLASGRRVLYVGDGINDAPVLGGATASVAVGSASDYARSAADVVLLTPGPGGLVELVRTARRTRARIRRNLTWAFGYNLLVLPAALAGLLAPWMAAIGMSLSSLVVVVGSARLAGRAPDVEARR